MQNETLKFDNGHYRAEVYVNERWHKLSVSATAFDSEIQKWAERGATYDEAWAVLSYAYEWLPLVDGVSVQMEPLTPVCEAPIVYDLRSAVGYRAYDLLPVMPFQEWNGEGTFWYQARTVDRIDLPNVDPKEISVSIRVFQEPDGSWWKTYKDAVWHMRSYASRSEIPIAPALIGVVSPDPVPVRDRDDDARYGQYVMALDVIRRYRKGFQRADDNGIAYLWHDAKRALETMPKGGIVHRLIQDAWDDIASWEQQRAAQEQERLNQYRQAATTADARPRGDRGPRPQPRS